jgi:hypothetical protein
MRLPALLAPVPDPGVIASIDRLWSAKTKTVVDPLNHFSYIVLVLASRRLCSMHRSSDTSAPGGSPAGPSLPSCRHAAGRAVRSGWVKTAGGNAEIQKGRKFNGFAGVCGSAEIRRNSRRPAVEPGNAKCRFCRVSGDSAGPPPGPEEAGGSVASGNFRQSRTNAIPFAVQPVKTTVQSY